MSRPTFTVVFGVPGKDVFASLTKIGLDEDQVESIIEAELLQCEYHGNSHDGASYYLGMDLSMLDESENIIKFEKLIPQGLETAKKAAEFKNVVSTFKQGLEELGIEELRVAKFKLPPPTCFIVVGTD